MKENREALYFPLFVDLSKKRVLVVGAGTIAARRIRTLLDFAQRITVVAPDVSEEIRSLQTEAGDVLSVICRPFEPEDLEGADLVLAATNDPAVNETVGRLCKEKKIPGNVSHKKELCDYYFPGIVRKEQVVVGVTASGTDHAKARAVTEIVRKHLSGE